MTEVQNGRPATPPTEIPMLRAYRLWFEHTRTCGIGCKGTPKAQDGCEDGRRLGGAYRLARIGKATAP